MIANATISEGVAILQGPRTSFLDHLIPLCHLWDIPLLCTDEWVASCAQTFYPPTPVVMASHANFQEKVKDFTTFVTVEPCKLHPEALQFGDCLYKGKGKTVAGFHGNPSKFRDTYWIERYADEDLVLIYGRYLIDYLQEKGVWNRLKQTLTIGNLRKSFYEANRLFFDAAVKPYLFPKRDKKTIFWAPTWTYPEPPTGYETLLDTLPDDFQILVKLHPFIYRLFPDTVDAFQERYGEHERIRLIPEIPLIYPFIEAADMYVGDSSSVAFDFLSVNRPMFILGKESYPWATTVSDSQALFAAMRREDTLSEMRQEAYRYVFEGAT